MISQEKQLSEEWMQGIAAEYSSVFSISLEVMINGVSPQNLLYLFLACRKHKAPALSEAIWIMRTELCILQDKWTLLFKIAFNLDFLCLTTDCSVRETGYRVCF